MYLFGTLNTMVAYLLLFGLQETEGAMEIGESAMIELVASIYHFLFATILVVFSIGLYALFPEHHPRAGQWKHNQNAPPGNR